MADPSTYTVGWICALTTELVAARSFFDEEYEVTLETQAPGDNNSYSLGRMGKHDVVVACLPRAEYGIAPAASVAKDMLRTFPNIRVGLMVGIGGGAPRPEHDIRLGDVVVSVPSGAKGGVLHHARGKKLQQQEFQLTGSLNQPPQFLLTAVGLLESDYEAQGHELKERIEEALNARPRLRRRYARPLAAEDRLYESSHIHRESPESALCKDNCGEERLITRNARGDDEDDPTVHYGLIASSDKLMKDATMRDKLAMEEGVLCFEMEAAGLMNHFPCLIIRGICDYADSHKNKQWQGFAAMTAAVYAKELLRKILPTNIQHQKPLAKVLGEIGIELKNITTNVEDTNATVNTMHASNRRLEIERWLKPPRSSTNVAKAKKRRHDGTGQWFIQGQAFTEFKAGSRKHLWLHGLAGCGKTVLSSQILDDLSAIEGSITLAHYFDFNDVEKQSLNGLLRSIVFQLFQHGGEAASAMLHELFESCEKGSKDPGEGELESCITSMLRTVDRVFILIDALDECRSRDSLLPWIGQIAVENVQFLLTARPEGDIQPHIFRFFGEENCFSLDKTAVNGDIKSYVLSVLDKNPRFVEKRLSEELRKDICIKVGEGADGMFRWAACQMDTLEACLTPNAVREALVSLPRDLPKTYDRMMKSIPLQYKCDSIRLLQFIMNCKQPLSPSEAVEILATRPDQHHDRFKFDPGNRLFNSSHIERYCPGMIHIVQVTGEDLDENGDVYRWEEVHLTHFSVKEYLTKIDTFCDLNSAIVITETLINYLYDVKDPLYRVRADFPLAIRAEHIWYEFARRAQTVEKIVQMTVKLLFSGLQRTVAYMMENTELKVQTKDKESCLMWAILNGFPEVAEVLLRYGVSPDPPIALDGSAVYKASKRGYAQLVRKLIKAGADFSGDTLDWSGDPTSALCAASEHGHLEIVQDLLKAGNHARMQDSLQRAVGNGHTAIVELLVGWGACEAEPIHDHVLEMAAFRGTTQLLCRLLDARPHGYDQNIRDRFLWEYKLDSALSRACEAGRIDNVRLLISRGAQSDHYINFQYEDSKYSDTGIVSGKHSKETGECRYRIRNRGAQNCLVLAAQSGNEDIVKMLLDKEFDLSQVLDLSSTASMYVGEAFVMALLGCHQRVIITLLDAMVNHAYTDEIATLRAASEDQNQYIIRMFSDSMKHDMRKRRRLPDFSWLVEELRELLLGNYKHICQILLKEAGSDYFIRDKYSDQVLLLLEVAASVGSVVTIEKFIQAGVDLNIACSVSVTSDSVAHMLLDHGADYDHIVQSGDTVCHIAAKNGKLSVVERLLNLGDFDKKNSSGYTPLHVASNADIIRVLLVAGFNANARDDNGWTALHNAALQGNPHGIEVLLRYGANADTLTVHGTTALQVALGSRTTSDRDMLRIAKLLLDSWPGANIKDSEGSTPLHSACLTYGVKVVGLLLAKGADVNAVDNEGTSPFHMATRRKTMESA
ncbi:hypothetical protein FPANT_6050 [Fusarium pseudoanthophilum]|uniref:Nephrocystin 3-like N-terminal domain-containing protein n=1 Tax=Fusarium pseudoanthophilum TaxID=48495 RepID=A0A8H5LG05_9HYPO|nr:hypothetical protein FPANT_6050 [Fusarium pseudoanthophilum]